MTFYLLHILQHVELYRKLTNLLSGFTCIYIYIIVIHSLIDTDRVSSGVKAH